jgi:hypothetical protein
LTVTRRFTAIYLPEKPKLRDEDAGSAMHLSGRETMARRAAMLPASIIAGA